MGGEGLHRDNHQPLRGDSMYVDVATLHGFLEAAARRQPRVSPTKKTPHSAILTGIFWKFPKGQPVPNNRTRVQTVSANGHLGVPYSPLRREHRLKSVAVPHIYILFSSPLKGSPTRADLLRRQRKNLQSLQPEPRMGDG